jgi:ADP-heptose:LPS heptosyltransferase
MSDQQQILVIKHGALGDLILATGAMKAIRERHPQARITLLTCPPYDALMADCPFIDGILIDPKPKLWQWSKIKALKQLLQSQTWEWVYDLQTSQRSTTYFPLLRTRYYSGLSPKGSHPHLTPERTSLHTLDRLAQQMRLAGIDETPAPDVSWLQAEIDTLLSRHCEERSDAAIHADSQSIATTPSAMASRNDKLILFVPGGAPHRPAKRWPAEHYAELARRLISEGYTPILIGTKAEEAILQKIAATDEKIINLIGQTSFAQIATLARVAKYAVGNDTGPMHLISATGCPSTVIFNTLESSPEKSAPRGDMVNIAQAEDLSKITTDTVAELFFTLNSLKS